MQGNGMEGVEIRNIKESIPSSRNRATVHWTVALNCSNLSAEKKKQKQ